jgi:hypothetical protein
VTGVLVQAVLLIFVMAALLILAQAANIHSATTLQGEPVLNIFFYPIFFFIEKKASAAFITNYVTGLNMTYKIFR